MPAPPANPTHLIHAFTIDRPSGGLILVGVEADGTTWMRTLAVQAQPQTYVLSSPWVLIPIGSI